MKLIDEILKLDEKFQCNLKENTELLNSMRELCKKLSIEDFKDMSFKEYNNVFCKIIDLLDEDVDLEFQLKELWLQKERELFPLNKACYYTVLNDIDFLSKESIVKLDIMLYDSFRTNLEDFNKEELFSVLKDEKNIQKVMKFLMEHGIIKKEYTLHCYLYDYNNNESEVFYFLKESKLNAFKNVWKLGEKVNSGLATDEEKLEYKNSNKFIVVEDKYSECEPIKIASEKEFDEIEKIERFYFAKKPNVLPNDIPW